MAMVAIIASASLPPALIVIASSFTDRMKFGVASACRDVEPPPPTRNRPRSFPRPLMCRGAAGAAANHAFASRA